MNDSDLLRRFTEEFTRLNDNPEVLSLGMTRMEMWCIFCQLQLAFRHPENTGLTRQLAEKTARRLQAIAAPSGALAEVAEMGWDPQYDA